MQVGSAESCPRGVLRGRTRLSSVCSLIAFPCALFDLMSPQREDGPGLVAFGSPAVFPGPPPSAPPLRPLPNDPFLSIAPAADMMPTWHAATLLALVLSSSLLQARAAM